MLADGKKVDDNGGPTVRGLLGSGWGGRELRFWLLSTHYHKPVVFSAERLGEARRTLQRLDGCIAGLGQIQAGTAYKELDQLLYDLKSGFNAALEDDLNISAALAVIFKVVKEINRLVAGHQIAAEQVPAILSAFKSVDAVLGIFDFEPVHTDPNVRQLLDQRQAARQAKNWAKADALRQELEKLGVAVRDDKLTT